MTHRLAAATLGVALAASPLNALAVPAGPDASAEFIAVNDGADLQIKLTGDARFESTMGGDVDIAIDSTGTVLESLPQEWTDAAGDTHRPYYEVVDPQTVAVYPKVTREVWNHAWVGHFGQCVADAVNDPDHPIATTRFVSIVGETFLGAARTC